MEIYERCIEIESCPNAFDPGGLIKYIRKSKRVKGIFSRVQWLSGGGLTDLILRCLVFQISPFGRDDKS